MVNHLLFAYNLALISSYKQGRQHEMMDFRLCPSKREHKLTLKRPRYYISSDTQSSKSCKEAALHCGKFTHLSTGWWYSRVERGTKRLIQKLINLTQTCVSFFALWWKQRELSNTANVSVFKSVFVLTLTYDHESRVVTECYLKYKWKRLDLAWSSFGVEPAELLNLPKTVRYFDSCHGYCPSDSFQNIETDVKK